MLPIFAYWIGAALLALLFGSKGFGFWGHGNMTIRLAILGIKSSGKTTLQIALRQTDKLPKNTPNRGEPVDSHTIIRNGRKVVLGSGLDVSGDLQTIRRKYKDEIINNDAIIFLFNAYAFTADEKYRSEVLSLLFFIKKHNVNKIPINPIGSFIDLLIEEGHNIEKVKIKIENALNHENELVLINLLDKAHIENLIKKIFKL